VVDLSGWFPACIRYLTRSRYCHAFVCLGDGMILEAQPSGSAISPLSKYAGLPMLFSEPAPGYRQDADPEQDEKRWLRIPYGFDDILYLGLAYGLHLRPRWLLAEVEREDRMICSQLVAEWGACHGAAWSCGQPSPQLVTPGLLADRIAA
jgi:hypothetical protein